MERYAYIRVSTKEQNIDRQMLALFEERMQVNGQEIPPEELAEITAWIRPLAESCPEAPTEFELVTCVAL